MKNITVKELKTLMDKNEDFQLIDVREAEEKEYSDIGGELIPMGEIVEKRDLIEEDKKVVFYCRSGSRSSQVVALLESHFDLDNLYNLEGGILAWADEIDASVPKY